MASDFHTDPRRQIKEILDRQELETLYQPIMNLDSGGIIGFEGYVRGPSWSSLVSPVSLFRVARRQGLEADLGNLTAEILVSEFHRRQLNGNLFINCTNDVFSLHPFMPCLRGAQASEDMAFILAIKELEHSTQEEIEAFLGFLDDAASTGIRLCLDHELLVALSQIEDWQPTMPDFVKVNKYVMENLAKDRVKQQRVQRILEQIQVPPEKLIAEGIETQIELITAKELGIGCAQGRYIARPTNYPSHVPSAASLKTLNTRTQDSITRKSPQERTLGETTLIREIEPVSPETHNSKVFNRFETTPNLELIPVVDNGIPQGLISRFDMIDNFARPYRSELFGRKPCNLFMDSDPLIVDINLTIHELTKLASSENPKHLSRGFIITHKRKYLGVATGQDLVREMTELQLESARHSNPLTQLPGNIYIADKIDEFLRGDQSFVVCYFDLDHFKPFNDVYGYSAGDELIRMTANVLKGVYRHSQDFLGHIGGDDFIAIFTSEDWRERCETGLARFETDVRQFFSHDDLDRGGYITENRKGVKEFQPLTTLSIGAVRVLPGNFKSHHDVARVAAEAKKMAKKTPGNSLYVNQRNYSEDP